MVSKRNLENDQVHALLVCFPVKEASSIVTHYQHWERLASLPLITWLLTCWICSAVFLSQLPQGGHRGLTGWGSDEDPPRTMGLPSCVWGCEWVHVRVCMCVQSSSYCCSYQKKRRDRILYLCFILGSFGRWMPGSTTWGESAHSSSSLSCNPPSGSLLSGLDSDEFLETIYEDGKMDISSYDTTMLKDKPGLFKHYRSWLLPLSAKLRPHCFASAPTSSETCLLNCHNGLPSNDMPTFNGCSARICQAFARSK